MKGSHSECMISKTRTKVTMNYGKPDKSVEYLPNQHFLAKIEERGVGAFQKLEERRHLICNELESSSDPPKVKRKTCGKCKLHTRDNHGSPFSLGSAQWALITQRLR